jgi:GNAT superfamily N-acetyltransferase
MVDRQLVERIEEAALWAWPPEATAWDDGWLLRAAADRARRVNSVRTLVFAAGSDVDGAIGRVERWYAGRARPACFQLTELAAPAGLDATLAGLDYVRLPSVSVLLVDAGRVPPPGRGEPVEIETRPTPLVMNAICDPRWGAPARRARAELFARIRKTHAFAVLTVGGQPASGGLCVVDGALAGLFTLRTETPHRGRGFARAVVRRLAAWARHHGAERLYAQVEDDNEAAMALHRPFGGERAYGYWYREQPADF